MTTQTQTAAPATTPAKKAVSRATDAARQVAVRPIAVGMTNAATIGAATLVHVAGPMGLAVAAGGAVAAAGAGAAARARRNRRVTGSVWRSSASRTTGGGRSLGLPRLGGASTGRRGSGLGLGGGRAGSGAAGRGRAGAGSAGRAGGARSGGLPSLGRSRSGAAGRGRSGSGTGVRGLFGGSGSGRLTPSRVAAARRKIARQLARTSRPTGPRLSEAIRKATAPGAAGQRPTARQAWRDARKAITGDSPKRRGTIRRAMAGVAAGGVAAGKAAWDRRRQRRKAERARQGKVVRAKTGRQQNQRGVRTALRQRPGQRPTSTRAVTPPPPATKAQRPTNVRPGGVPAASTTGGSAMNRQLLAASEDFLAAAVRDQPEGMLQVVADAHMIPGVIDNLAKAMKLRFDRAQEQPLHPAILELYGAVHAAQRAVVAASADIAPAIERLHEPELKRLRNPRPREEMWDRRANQDAA